MSKSLDKGKTAARSLRVPDQDWHAWRQHAASLGKSVSDWLRELAHAAIDPERPAEENK